MNRIIKIIEDPGTGAFFRIRRVAEDDAIVETMVTQDGRYGAVDDETASRVFMTAYLSLFDAVDEMVGKADAIFSTVRDSMTGTLSTKLK